MQSLVGCRPMRRYSLLLEMLWAAASYGALRLGKEITTSL